MRPKPLDPFAEALLDEAAAARPEVVEESPQRVVEIDLKELRRRWEAGGTLKEIAAHFGVSPSAIDWRVVRLGLRPVNLIADWAAIQALWYQGLTIEEIADRLNFDAPAVRALVGKSERELGAMARRGQVLAWAQKGLTQTEIAEKVGIGQGRVSQILASIGGYGIEAIEQRHKEILDLHDTGRTPEEIAEETGAGPWTVGRVLRDLGIAPNSLPGQIRTDRENVRLRHERIWDLDDEGVSREEIASAVGMAVHRVNEVIREKPSADFRLGRKIFKDLVKRTGLPPATVREYLQMPEEEKRRLLESTETT